MIKVQILTPCKHCKGEAYLPFGETESYTGEPYTSFQACPECQGTGNQQTWISLDEFVIMVQQATCTHEHTSFWGGFHLSGGDVWDDITEVCDDCGAILEGMPVQVENEVRIGQA